MLNGVTIIVPMADGGIPLRVIRCLGRHGARVVLFSSDASTPAQRSRYCRTFVHVGGDADDGVLVDRLMHLGRAVPPEIVLPVTTAGFRFVARNRERLAERFLLPPLAGDATLGLASDKWRLHRFATTHELPVLPSISMTAEAVARILAGDAEFGFPVLVKPSNRENGRGFRRCDTPGELQALHRHTGDDPAQPHLIQPFVDGFDVSVSAFCRNGEVRAHTTWRAQFYGSDRFTIPRCIRFEPQPHALTVAARLLRLLDWEGICDIDLFVDRRTGDTRILEVNARFWGNVNACAVAGVDFPLLMCQSALGREPGDWPRQEDGTVYCYPRGIPRLMASPGIRGLVVRRPLVLTGADTILRDPAPEIGKACWKLGRALAGIRRPGRAPAPGPEGIAAVVSPESEPHPNSTP